MKSMMGLTSVTMTLNVTVFRTRTDASWNADRIRYHRAPTQFPARRRPTLRRSEPSSGNRRKMKRRLKIMIAIRADKLSNGTS
jgi:hypothetical protein